MRGLLTTQSQDCYREQIEKEIYARLAWNVKYGQQYPCRPTTRRTKKPGFPILPPVKVLLPPVEEEKKKQQEEEMQSAPVIHELHPFVEISLMRPVSPNTKEMLNEGLSTQGSGRTLYLRKRLEKNPEEKYPHPELSSWEYGWRLGDYVKDFRCPINGRSGIVRDTFYARNGIFSITSPTDRIG